MTSKTTENARHSSASNEHYTPTDIVESARRTLVSIDLDPASCAAANTQVRANRYYDKEMNGYTMAWEGRVFLNPPGGWADDQGRPVLKASGGLAPCTENGRCGLPPGHRHSGIDSSQKMWWQKLARCWENGEVSAAVFVCFSIELLQSTQVDAKGPLPLEFPICYPSRRVAYIGEDGKVGASPPHASCIVCVSNTEETIRRFVQAFFRLGHVVVPGG